MLIQSKFRPAWWLRNPHLQTIWAAKARRLKHPETTRERLQTPDGDFLDLDWTDGDGGPIVAIFHGLGGSRDSAYVKALMHKVQSIGMRAVLMHFRGCSGEPNRTAGSYHSGHTVDIALIANLLHDRWPHEKLAAVGYSLGGNALLEYLAATPDNPFASAISVSPPLVLQEGAKRLSKGFSTLYQRVLIEELKKALRAKHAAYPHLRLNETRFEEQNTFWDFDDKVTAPLHGYTGADDYYQRASSRSDLIRITTPTHIIFSADDPFFTAACIPAAEELSASVTFELTTHGGHVGFVAGCIPLLGHYWLDRRLGKLLVKTLRGDQPIQK